MNSRPFDEERRGGGRQPKVGRDAGNGPRVTFVDAVLPCVDDSRGATNFAHSLSYIGSRYEQGSSVAFSAIRNKILDGERLRRYGGSAVFWAVVLAFYTVYFGRETGRYEQSFVFVSLLLPVAIATTAVITEFLVPKYLMRRRYGLFALYLTYTTVGAFYLEMVVVVVFYIFVAEYEITAIDPAALSIVDLTVGLYFGIFLALSVQLGRRWYQAQSREARTEQDRLEVELKLREAELAMLRAQIQPHFLFNTLNNLYGLTLEQSKDAPAVVLQLSDLLDYVLYRSGHDSVPLADEVAFLRAYIDLECLRFVRLDMRFEEEGVGEEVRIAPLVLMPFVENGFKHGIRPSSGQAWLSVRLTVEGERLDFVVENSKPVAAGMSERADTDGGLGLDNVRRRLDLLYGDRYSLSIEDAADSYLVRLNIPLQ